MGQGRVCRTSKKWSSGGTILQIFQKYTSKTDILSNYFPQGYLAVDKSTKSFYDKGEITCNDKYVTLVTYDHEKTGRQ